MSRKHEPLGPSGLSRALACPASVPWDEEPQSSDNAYTAVGTHAHNVAADHLQNGAEIPDEVRFCNRCNAVVEEAICAQCNCPEYRIESDFGESVKTYVDFILNAQDIDEPLGVFIETKLMSEKIEGFGGTCDYYHMYKAGGKLYCLIVDYKHGEGTPVELHGNAQLLGYAALIQEKHGGVEAFYASIVQPRCPFANATDFVVIRAEDVTEFTNKISQLKDWRDVYNAGDHCSWCHRLETCDHLYKISLEAARAEFAEMDEPDPEQLERMLFLLDRAKPIKKLLDAIPRRLLEWMSKGVEIPGKKAVQTYGHRRWIEADEGAMLKLLQRKKIGKKLATEAKLLSVAKLEKLVDPKDIEDLWVKPEGGFAIVDESDKRPAATLPTAETEFSDYLTKG